MNYEELDLTDAQILRIKAEEKLKVAKKANTPVKETEVKRLLHELQVHQIELEMQNEELRQANETAEKALEKYTMLFDFAPMGYFTLNHDGSIDDLNFTGAEMLGDKRFCLFNCNFKLFVDEESLPTFNNFFNRLFTLKTKESCEVMLGYDENPLCRVYMEGIVTSDDKQCLLSVIDVSDFKK